MFECPRGLREVIPNQTVPVRCKEFTVVTGGAHSTLQDIKLPDAAGGYVYNDDSPCLANRTLYWRTHHDTLELCEVSLNYNLVGSRIKYRFQDTPLLAGVSIHESWGNVVVLVPTVGSVHKLTFPHPTRLENRDTGGMREDGLLSVLAEASLSTARDCQHQLQLQQLPTIATSFLTQDEEAVFVLGNSLGQLTCVKLGRVRGMTSVNVLAAPSNSYLGRVWTTFTSKNDNSDQPQSLVMANLAGAVSLLAVCRDHKLRVWNLTSYECVLVTDLLQFTAEAGRQLQQGAQGHRISLVQQLDAVKDEITLCIYFCFHQHRQFLVVDVQPLAGQLTVNHRHTLYSPDHDLVSYTATSSSVTAVWTTSDGDTLVRRAVVGGAAGWDTVTLAECDMGPDPDVDVDIGQEDPRQVYLGALFEPGSFQAATLARTVAIFRRSVDSGVPEDMMSWQRLREEVVAAVEGEIQQSLVDYEVTDEDYVAVSQAAWARFYSCAAQYRAAGRQPMGLVAGPASSAVMLVRREIVSWCRPVEALEQVVITGGEGATIDIFSEIPPLADDPSLAGDVLHLLVASGMVANLLSPGIRTHFADAVSRLCSPDLVGRSITADLLADQQHPEALQQITARLQQVQNLSRALEVILYCLELDHGSVSSGQLNLADVTRDCRRVFSSKLGTSVVAESLRQQVHTRLVLCQNLLILQQLCGSTGGVSTAVLDTIQSTFLPRFTVMVHCYSVLAWLADAPASIPPPATLEQGVRQIAVLKLMDVDTPAAISLPQSGVNTSVLEMFLTGPGSAVRGAVGGPAGDSWLIALPPLINMTAQLLWPRCAVPTFLNFLLTSCQHGLIQQYCRLLSTWCDWHCHARQFLLASALLNMGEPEKALDWFLTAAGGVPGDKFLTDDLLGLVGPSADDMTVQYFLRVTSLLEQFSCPDLVISLAETALAVCPIGHVDRPTIAYILFSYHLKLGHNDDAYDAMVSNPDTRRRKDSLRQFLVTLFDRGELGQLARYPYIDMLDDVESIIESRARSADLSVNNYYDFLYSFHIMKENYRKGAHVMYECGTRLGTELCTLAGLKKQVQSYLAAINSLKLVSERYQWIVKPGPVTRRGRALAPGVSPKRDVDGEEKSGPVGNMEVVELAEIEKELILTQARLKLAGAAAGESDGALPAGPGLTPGETVALLVAANLYTSATLVCETFGVSVTGVAEGLAGRAARLAQARPAEQDAAWAWIAENNPGGVEIQGECAVEAVWQLLKHIVTSKEKAGETSLHRSVVCRLFTLGCNLPPWLTAGYKMKDPAELIRLYHQHGYIEAAAELAVEYLEAVLGTGAEYFGLKGGLVAGSRPAWVPWRVLDRLVLELKDNCGHQAVAKCLDNLEKALNKYMATAERVSRDMVAARA